MSRQVGSNPLGDEAADINIVDSKMFFNVQNVLMPCDTADFILSKDKRGERRIPLRHGPRGGKVLIGLVGVALRQRNLDGHRANGGINDWANG